MLLQSIWIEFPRATSLTGVLENWVEKGLH